MDGPIRVLHVDDEPDFADLTATFLERHADQLTVETATSASAGLDLLADAAVDCIISDYDMPGRDGLEFLEDVRDAHPDLPFILFTGKGSEEVASDAISAGVTDYLQKGGGTEQYELLAARIRNAVEKARMQTERERQLHAIETAREGIAILDEDLRFITVNDAYASLFGYDPGEMVGESWRLVYAAGAFEDVSEEISPALRGEGYYHGETTFERADGSTVVGDHVVSKTGGGEYVCLARDVTERKEREWELEVKTRAMDEAPVGITLTDPTREDNPLVYANDEFLDITGYDREDVLGWNHRCLQGPETREEPVAELRRAIDAGESTAVELRNYRKDGSMFWNRVTIAPLRDEDGTVTDWMGFQEEVTERKERERELQRYRAFLEEARDIITVLDDDGTIEYMNPSVERVLGYAPSELEGAEGFALVPPEDREAVLETFASLLETPGATARVEVRFRTADGELRWLEVDGINQLDNPAIEGVVAISRDVTGRKEREHELERQNERLESFASVVSHDLRNPLNVAELRLDLAREDCDSEHLEEASTALQRSQALIDDLLALAREGEPVSDVEPVDLAGLARDCWHTVETAAATLDVDTDRTVRADSGRLKQLLENLFANSVEHSRSGRAPDDGGEDVTITVGDHEDGFYVADDGPGIPADKREQVFESGYSTVEGGTGFGLAIVSEIAEAHGWSVAVTESEDGGARFEVTGVETADRA